MAFTELLSEYLDLRAEERSEGTTFPRGQALRERMQAIGEAMDALVAGMAALAHFPASAFDAGEGVQIVRVAQRTGEDLWAVRSAGEVLSRFGEWAPEPSPSRRTAAWIADHRFASATAAAQALHAARGRSS